MKNNITTLVKQYKELETISHIWIDDVINKVTQEVAELIEAFNNWDQDEMYKEASDVLVNILSVSNNLWINTEENLSHMQLTEDPMRLVQLNWKWNQKVQWLRARYSRENVTIEDVSIITSELIKEVMNYSDPESSMVEMIQNNIEKFTSRLDQYIPKINIEDYIWEYENFPKQWIDFKDISPILKSPEAFRYVCMEMAKESSKSDVIVWLDSRWFLFWTMVAQALWKPFVMVRKAWKLPWEVISKDYGLEYWNDIVEIQNWVIEKGQKVSIIDDLLATWWTAKAAIDLVEKVWWEVNNMSFVISLDDKWLAQLDSRKQLDPYKLNAVVSYS